MNLIEDPLSCNTNLIGSGTYNDGLPNLTIRFLSTTENMSFPYVFDSSSPDSPITIVRVNDSEFSFVLDIKKAKIPNNQYEIVATSSDQGIFLATTSYITTVGQEGCISTMTKINLIRTGGKI